MAFDPWGRPWIAYFFGVTSTCNNDPTTECSLGVATYVGSGGTGCTGTSEWTCFLVDNPTGSTDIGQYPSLAIAKNGTVWISYYDGGNTALKVASYVPGTAASGSCAADWLCETVDNTGTSTGQATSIAIDANNTPWVSFYDTTNTNLRVATRSKDFGVTCTDTDWSCGVVDSGSGNTGTSSAISISPANVPWVSYADVDEGVGLKVANLVNGSGCGGSGSPEWTCEAVETGIT
jgi:hypothetical protein